MGDGRTAHRSHRVPIHQENAGFRSDHHCNRPEVARRAGPHRPGATNPSPACFCFCAGSGGQPGHRRRITRAIGQLPDADAGTCASRGVIPAERAVYCPWYRCHQRTRAPPGRPHPRIWFRHDYAGSFGIFFPGQRGRLRHCSQRQKSESFAATKQAVRSGVSGRVKIRHGRPRRILRSILL